MIWYCTVIDANRVGLDQRLYARCTATNPHYPVTCTADLYHDWYPLHTRPFWVNGTTFTWMIDKTTDVIAR